MNTQAADEYRFLSFLFCDLVDSTPLSQALHHEDWRSIMRQFQSTCVEQVHQHGGVVYEYQGDGFLFYFGYPTAREDSACRAIQAALALVEHCKYGMKESNDLLEQHGQHGLRIRVGVHSGYVLIGTQDGRDLATGFPLAFTQRIQTVAAPNSVVISEDTSHLVDGQFKLLKLGEQQLKGIAHPVVCYLVNPSNANGSSRVERTRFVGRVKELQSLQKLWQATVEDGGRIQLICGDAGIGKSRLLKQFLNDVPDASCLAMTWKCSPDHTSSALYPIVQGVASLLGLDKTTQLASADNNPDVDAILKSHLGEKGTPAIMFAMSTLLSSISGTGRADSANISDNRKTAVLDGLVDWLVSKSLNQPICLVFEDIHWIDPSSMMLLERLHTEIDNSQILLLMTCRNEFIDDRHVQGVKVSTLFQDLQSTALALEKLSRQSSHEFVRSLQGANELPHDVISRLVARSDGIPLFIEESAAMLIDNSHRDQSTKKRFTDPDAQIDTVPVRLMDLLSVRLDSTGDARQTAGLAASIGRQFHREILLSVSELNPVTVEQHLQSLLDSCLVMPHDNDTNLLVFKHALVRDAAYAALPDSTKRVFHKRIGHSLETMKQAGRIARPELIAYHFTVADLHEKAIDYWLLAGKESRMQANPAEAISQYQQAHDLLHALGSSDTYPVKDKSLQMYLGCGSCHIALEGYGSDDARKCYEAAEVLAAELKAVAQTMKVRFGLGTHYFMRGNFEKAREYTVSCMEESTRLLAKCQNVNQSDDSVTRSELTVAQSQWAHANVLFHQGEFKASGALMEQCMELRKQAITERHTLAHDPGIMCHLYTAWYECEAGLLDKSLARVRKTVELARKTNHAYTIGIALTFNACVHFFRNEYQGTIELATQSIEYTEKPGYKTWYAWAKVLRGRAMCESSESIQRGMTEIVDGLQLWENSGAIVTRPFTLALLAESQLLNGQIDQALAHIKAAQDIVDQFGERYYEAEIYRISGVIHLKHSCQHRARAEAYFRHAIQFASERGLYRSVLRSAIELARTQPSERARAESLAILKHARDKISGGDSSSDLLAADQLIDSVDNIFDQDMQTYSNDLDANTVQTV